jgi:hypothetical protein
MTAKEKAEEIIYKYVQILPYHSKESNLRKAIESALVTVDEVLDVIYSNHYDIGSDANVFWENVKIEISLLKHIKEISVKKPSGTPDEQGCIELTSWEKAEKVTLNGYVYVRSADLTFCNHQNKDNESD